MNGEKILRQLVADFNPSNKATMANKPTVALSLFLSLSGAERGSLAVAEVAGEKLRGGVSCRQG